MPTAKDFIYTTMISVIIAAVGFILVFPHILGTHIVWFNDHICVGCPYWSWCVQITGFLTGYGISFILLVVGWIVYKLCDDSGQNNRIGRRSRYNCNV